MAKIKDVFTEIDEIVCNFYLIKQNQTEAYLLYRRLKNMGELAEVTVRGQAYRYFKEEKIKKYVKYELEKLSKRFGGDGSFTMEDKKSKVKMSSEIDYTQMSDEEIRNIALQTLFFVKDDGESTSSDRIAAVKNITDIMNAKKNDKPLSETERLIHYILPADICENCDKREQIYAEHGFEATQEEIQEAFTTNRAVKTVNNVEIKEEIELNTEEYEEDEIQ